MGRAELDLNLQRHLQAQFGAEQISCEPKELSKFEQALFPTSRRIVAVLNPRNPNEVALMLRYASAHAIRIYPISNGYNWGLGSRVPTADSCCVMDLSRMNRIRRYDPELGYLVVEPGVSFSQAAKYLEARDSKHFLASIGGPADASIVGNALERGDGVGPLGDRARSVVDLEVVLPDGKIIRTGYSVAEDSLLASIAHSAPGPDLDGLFMQSSFGVVTALTVWLQLIPKRFQVALARVSTTENLAEALPTLRALQAQGVIKPNSLALWNRFKVAAAICPAPWLSNGGSSAKLTELSAAEKIRSLPEPWDRDNWFGVCALYSASNLHARAERMLIKAALGARASVVRVLRRCGSGGGILHFLNRLWSSLSSYRVDGDFGIPLRHLQQVFCENSVALGKPTVLNLKSLYWRKPSIDHTAKNKGPHADGCGAHWLCHAIPFTGEHFVNATAIVERIAFSSGFEPNMAVLNPCERYLRAFIVLMYDRDAQGEDERAMHAARTIARELNCAGYTAYRLGIQTMDTYRPTDLGYVEVLRGLKQYFDPGGVLAPGRYDLFDELSEGG